MISKETWATISAVYDHAHMMLWAILVAFVIYFVTAVLPNFPAAYSQAERLRAQQIAAENEFYCNKWGMGPHTPTHDQCILDLQAFRVRVEERFSDENGF